MFVVLRFHNDYDQHGGYFVSLHVIKDDCVSPNGHFGRSNNEYVWYEIMYVETDKEYKIEDHPC